MDLDILAALDGEEATVSSGRKCKIQRWLDSIPEDQPGKDVLVLRLTTPNDPDHENYQEHYRTLEALDRFLLRLGFTTSHGTLSDHRSQRCRCFA